MQKPQALGVRPENIPADLRALDRWMMWRLVKRTKPDGTHVWAKMPLKTNGQAASATNPDTWTTYEKAIDTYILEGNFDGIGFALGEGLHGIDLDDCRDPETGELSALAQDVLDNVAGYAEVSPSGTGIKIITHTNLDDTRTDKAAGVELYAHGRYFTVTGHALGRGTLPDAIQDLGWLIDRVWGEPLAPAAAPLDGDASERALALYKPPLDDWPLERVIQELLSVLDPDCGYEEWLKIGAAMHHQSLGDPEWLDAWDDWSAGSSKWTEGYCQAKWDSFSAQRDRGHGALTLASLIKATAPARKAVAVQARQDTLADILFDIDLALRAQELQDDIAAKVAANGQLSDVEREMVVSAIQARSKELGTVVPKDMARRWCRHRPSGSREFPHQNEDGTPRCTMDNLRVLLDRLGVTVRYNVIKKAVEVMVPGAAFTRDNRDNASLACILSECEKVSMPTRHVQNFLLAIADENQFNPVLTWIESRVWDGVSRLQAFFDTVRSDAAIKDRLMRKWLIQCVAAAGAPDGIANQGILTFVGPQNIGKTSWFQRLAPDHLDVIFTGLTLDTRSKDSILTAVSHWIVELGEVDATMRKSDISALKSFITQPVDNIRRPYAASESQYGRRTAFGASVNDDTYLHDPTGNRRFWTVPVEGFVFDHGIDMQQLWAEVLTLWRGGERWSLTPQDVQDLADHNDEFTVVDPVEERLVSGFDWDAPDPVWEWISATDALLRIGFRDPTRGQSTKAGTVLRKLNGGQRRRRHGKTTFAVPGGGGVLPG